MNNRNDKLVIGLVVLNYAFLLPAICIAVYRHPPTLTVVFHTLLLSFWTWMLVECAIQMLAEHVVRRKGVRDDSQTHP